MTIKILTSEKQAEFLKTYTAVGIESISIEQKDNDPDFYWTTIKFNRYFDAELAAQIMFGAGINYGLDLQYSHYGTEPERVR